MIRVYLAIPTLEQQEFVGKLLEKDAQIGIINKPMQQQVKAMLSKMLTQEDW